MAALGWVLAARALGPSDAWDQSQPKTIAYTTDIIVNGNWILPARGDIESATKPPLYNWLAVPAVMLMGFSSEAGHKAPSIVALCLCWLIVRRLGRRLDPAGGEALGWLAAMCLVANYSFFKLGYLARPDMLLVLWLLLGWWACTVLLIDQSHTREPRDRPGLSAGRRFGVTLGFWLCLGLAGLTKGPAALPLLIYAVVAARLVGGKWTAFRALKPGWGLSLSLLVFGGWVWAAWRIDPQHVLRHLWSVEIAGRVTGLGPEGSGLGPVGVLETAPYMALYYLGFFFPWSFFSIMAMISLWSRPTPGAPRRWREMGSRGAMLNGAAIFVIVTIALYTFSASKRADYDAVSFGPGALLAAWWLLYAPGRLAVRAVWFAPVAAALVLTAHTIVNQLQPNSPCRGLGDAINRFSRNAETHLRAAPAPVVFLVDGTVLPQSYFGAEGHRGPTAMSQMIDERRPFWLFVDRSDGAAPGMFGWLQRHRGKWRLFEACRSEKMPPTNVWPQQMVLYRVEPVRRRPFCQKLWLRLSSANPSGKGDESVTPDMNVPLLELKTQYATIKDELNEAIRNVVESQRFVLGPEVSGLEQEIADLCTTRHAIGCASGSDAILLALVALGVGPGDEVICPPFTFFSTAGSVALLGATPVFADIDPVTYNIDPAAVRSAAGRCSRLKAVMPVHLYGQCADMEAFMQLGAELNVPIIEDAAQAIGSRDAQGHPAGSRGAIGCFSFYPSKNLGGIGDGGMVTTNDPDLAELLTKLRLHGETTKYHHDLVGFNSRLDAIQAAALRVKLRHLDTWTRKRQSNATFYSEAFAAAGAKTTAVPLKGTGLPLRTPHPAAGQGSHIHNQYVIRVPAAVRDDLRAHLGEHGIGTDIYYPVPLHLQKCFTYLGGAEGDCPVSESAARETIALPIFPELARPQLEHVAGTVVSYLEQHAAVKA
jgi:dTDP-4-amino-4,6-dideoxygalactose transaminase/4-amino-4-deoxy-L-arabinose transferase-like glycosyltransferase